MREITSALTAFTCLIMEAACSSLDILRGLARRTCGTCLQECAHGGPHLRVAANGDDRNPATRGAPWRTFQQAMPAAPAGATVHIEAGTCAERLTVNVSGSQDGCISFQPRAFVVPAGGCGGHTDVACGCDQVVVDLGAFEH